MQWILSRPVSWESEVAAHIFDVVLPLSSSWCMVVLDRIFRLRLMDSPRSSGLFGPNLRSDNPEVLGVYFILTDESYEDIETLNVDN